ncbi:MAG: prolipoprotein diacylglyceryl transferase [Firmicutes bacterium]|nr:prolipoprotein diacylglyceryl transferase [Bacillota bacterium]
MYTTISFPSFGISINPPSYFTIGPLTIHIYGVLIAVGLMLAVAYAWRRSHEFGIKEDDITDGVLCIVPFAVLCARLYYCVFQWEQYAANPISVLYIWKGGLAIYGGVIGAAIGVIVLCVVKKIKAPALLDLVSLGFLIGQCIGRWGNFFNREAFGAETDSFFRMGLTTVYGTTTYYHPTFLYESVWCLAGFLLLHFLSKRRRYDGQIALGYVAWYGFGRAWIEGLRTDSLYLGSLRVSQVLAALSCLTATLVLIYNARRKHDPQSLYVHQVERAAQEAAREPEAGPEAEEENYAEGD